MPCEYQDLTPPWGDYVWVCSETSKIYDEFPYREHQGIPDYDNYIACVEECEGPPAPINTELTCFATPDDVKVGETTNIYGILRGVNAGPGVPNQPVRLYRKKPGQSRFSYVTYVRTSGSGGYMFKNIRINVEGSWIFYTWFQGTDVIMPSISPEVEVVGYVAPPVKTETSLTMQSDIKVIPEPPGVVTLFGVLTRKDTGEGLSKIIDVYHQGPGGDFTLIAKKTTGYGTGEYALAVTLSEVGVHNFYTEFKGDFDYEPSQSVIVSVGVSVTPPPTPGDVPWGLVVGALGLVGIGAYLLLKKE